MVWMATDVGAHGKARRRHDTAPHPRPILRVHEQLVVRLAVREFGKQALGVQKKAAIDTQSKENATVSPQRVNVKEFVGAAIDKRNKVETVPQPVGGVKNGKDQSGFH